MSSATSTNNRPRSADTGFHAWHFFLLLSMIGATAAVMVSRDTHPVSLLLLSAAVIAAGFAGLAINKAMAGFFSRGAEPPVVSAEARESLEYEKALVLRSIKELEFDKDMRKISETDAAAIMVRLRARALALMEDLERLPEATATDEAAEGVGCPKCGTPNDGDARFCKQCGAKMGAEDRQGSQA
jgi:hypothetical protein